MTGAVRGRVQCLSVAEAQRVVEWRHARGGEQGLAVAAMAAAAFRAMEAGVDAAHVVPERKQPVAVGRKEEPVLGAHLPNVHLAPPRPPPEAVGVCARQDVVHASAAAAAFPAAAFTATTFAATFAAAATTAAGATASAAAAAAPIAAASPLERPRCAHGRRREPLEERSSPRPRRDHFGGPDR